MPVHTSTQALAKLQVKCRSPLLITLMLCASIASASDKSNDLLDDYGQLPLVRDVSISPDGKHYSFIRRMEDGTESFVIVNEQAAKVVGAANASELKARNIRFVSSDHIILTISTTAKSVYVRSDWENDIAVAYNFKTQSFAPLLGKNEELYPAQSVAVASWALTPPTTRSICRPTLGL